MSDVNQFDLAFVVDVTGSMGGFISAAQRGMIDMIKSAVTAADVDMRIGVVEYRDHPPQDTVIFRAHEFTDVEKAQKVLSKMMPMGGGDGPEAVLDGIKAACNLQWRPHSRRIAVLVGDAPPHGCGMHGDGFPKGCPCGETLESVAALAEEKNIMFYAIPLTNQAQAPFSKIAGFTGGESLGTSGFTSAIDVIKKILVDEFGNIKLDAAVLEAWNDESTTDSIANTLNKKSTEVAASIMRLKIRNLVTDKERAHVEETQAILV
jgi:hypothetical protein